jgi:hypothetical protein
MKRLPPAKDRDEFKLLGRWEVAKNGFAGVAAVQAIQEPRGISIFVGGPKELTLEFAEKCTDVSTTVVEGGLNVSGNVLAFLDAAIEGGFMMSAMKSARSAVSRLRETVPSEPRNNALERARQRWRSASLPTSES